MVKMLIINREELLLYIEETYDLCMNLMFYFEPFPPLVTLYRSPSNGMKYMQYKAYKTNSY